MNQQIRTVKIPLEHYLSDKEIKLFGQIAEQCKECFLRLKELAKSSGECCPITLYSQVIKNELEDLNLLTPQIAISIARKACRHVFASRSRIKEMEMEIPVNRCILKILEDRSLMFNFQPSKICCQFAFPKSFTEKYKFNERDFLWGNVNIVKEGVVLSLVYNVKELKTEFPLFFLSKIKETVAAN